MRRLSELETQYGIDQGKVLELLYPPIVGGRDLEFAIRVLRRYPLKDLPGDERRLRLWRKILAASAKPEEVRVIKDLMDKMTAHVECLGDLAQRMKLGRKKRKARPEEWEIIGDVAVALATYLDRKIPASRKKIGLKYFRFTRLLRLEASISPDSALHADPLRAC